MRSKTLHATHFDYDADGRKLDMTDATGTTSWYYAYDGIHLSQLASPQGCLTYVYDGDGRLAYKYLNLNNVFTYWYNTYDPAGRLTSLRSTLDGTTTFAYDAANRLTQKTFGNGNYDTYAYDSADQLGSIGYWWADTSQQNALVYTYTPGGSVQTVNQGYYATTYGYDGADQLTSETSTGTYAPPSLAFTYDHNGNRLTQTVNGSLAQSFTYNGHDVMTHGTAGNETPGWDYNGNETSNAIYGTTYYSTFDDEDRLIQTSSTSGPTDTYVYNGLGLRVGKTDTTGTYSYFCDGASPGSDVLSDGHALYTPGLSENKGGTSRYYSNDLLGNLWTLDGSSKNQTYYQDTTGFGTTIGSVGSGSVFGYGGGNGCQTDSDTGLVLMGHRYYDSRIGRFISQDPAGSGDNWYAYAGNSPVNEVDPDGLTPTVNIEGWSPAGSPGYSGVNAGAQGFDDFENFTKYTITHTWIQDHKLVDGQAEWVDRPGSDTWSISADPAGVTGQFAHFPWGGKLNLAR